MRSAEPMELITKAVDGLADWRAINGKQELFVWDEFREITRLKESAQREAVLRAEVGVTSAR